MSTTLQVIYKITYPNGKIYIGQDRTDDNIYMGSPSVNKLINSEFTPEQRKDFTLRKELLCELDCNASRKEVNKKEIEMIVKYHSNNPEIGYNLVPKFGGKYEKIYNQKEETNVPSNYR